MHTSISWSVSTHASPTIGALALRVPPAARLAKGLMTILTRAHTSAWPPGRGELGGGVDADLTG